MHRIYMDFMQRDGWHVYFMLPDLRTHLPRKLKFTDSQKIVETAKRGGMEQTSESKSALEHGISIGRITYAIFRTFDWRWSLVGWYKQGEQDL